MKKRIGRSTVKSLGRAMLMMVCAAFVATGAHAQTTVPIAPNVTPLQTQQAHRPNSGRPAGYGVLAGYVFWDTSAVKHTPANSCSGVNVTVARGGTIVGTSSGNIAYMQTVGAYAVCKYAVKSLPQGLDLQVGVDVASGAFSPAALPEQSKTVNIMGGAGGMCFGPVVPSQTELLGNWQTCPGYAEDVNFVLVPARGLLPSRVAGPVRVAPGTPVQQTGPLMNAGAQQAMLAAQANPLLADGGKQSQGALNGESRTAITNSTFTAGIQPAAVPQVGASQPMSATGNAANSRVLAPSQAIAAPAGSPSPSTGVLVAGGNNQGSPNGAGELATQPQTTTPGSLSKTGTGVLLGGGTNQGGSRTLAPNSLAANGPLNTGSGGGSAAGTNSSLQPLMPRGGSNTSSGGTGLMSLKPLIPRGNSSGGSSTGSASGLEKPLTNADVLNLLSARTSEQAILDRIRNHPATFDVSNQARASFDRACAGIKHPGVPTSAWATEIKHVWDTMVNVVICQQTNGRGGEGACDLTPLQSSPKKTSAGPTPIQPKVPGRTQYEPITAERGVTQDTGFANWANSGQAPNNGSPSISQVKPAMNTVGAVYGQSGNAPGGNSNACDVTQIRLRIGTGGDDLRGGQDNLNVLVYLTDAKPRVALNVNSSANWPNNSTHMVVIPIKPPVSPDEIRAIRLFHIADGGFNAQSLENGIMATPAAPIQIAKAFQSPDNWDMSGLVASALGNGVGLRIATYGFHRFTGSNPDLVIHIRRKVMANACGTGRSAANGGSGSGGGTGSGLNPALNPGGSGLRPMTGGGSGAGALGAVQSSVLTNDGVVRMVKAGVPESGIIAFIRVNPAKFDLSPNGLIALKQAGVSPKVQQEMIRHGSGPVSVPGAQPSGIGGAAKADDLSPQPYPPKAMLPASGSQKTMLDTTSTVPAQVPVQRTASPAGVGPSQTMNSPGNTPVSGALTQQAGTTAVAPASAAMVRAPFASVNNAVIVASACAKDPTFRVLGVSGTTSGGSGGVTLTVEQQYTILGCSFGNPPLVKRTTPVSSPQSLAAQPNHYNVSIWMTPPNMSLLDVDASIQSWSDNAIVVIFHHSATFDGGSISLPGKVFPAQLLVTRADGQTVIYGYEGGLFFKLLN